MFSPETRAATYGLRDDAQHRPHPEENHEPENRC